MTTETISQTLAPLHLLNHPFYQDWMAGKLTRTQLQDYACQYLAHVEAFPRYISAVHSLSQNSEHRKLLLENLNEEEGVTFGTSHPQLWKQFAKGLDVLEQELENTPHRFAIQNVISTFFKYTRSSFHEGLGAIYAYESQVPEIAESKIEGLKKFYNILDPETLQFFEVHKTADVYHRETIEAILKQLPEEQYAQAQIAAKEVGQALWDFLSDVHSYQQPLAV